MFKNGAINIRVSIQEEKFQVQLSEKGCGA